MSERCKRGKGNKGEGWKTQSRRGRSDVHVLPINDLREHEEHRACWCNPRVEIITRGDPQSCAVVSHNSMDGRELVEQHGVQ